MEKHARVYHAVGWYPAIVADEEPGLKEGVEFLERVMDFGGVVNSEDEHDAPQALSQ